MAVRRLPFSDLDTARSFFKQRILGAPTDKVPKPRETPFMAAEVAKDLFAMNLVRNGDNCAMETGARQGLRLAQRFYPSAQWSQSKLATAMGASNSRAEIMWCEYEKYCCCFNEGVRRRYIPKHLRPQSHSNKSPHSDGYVEVAGPGDESDDSEVEGSGDESDACEVEDCGGESDASFIDDHDGVQMSPVRCGALRASISEEMSRPLLKRDSDGAAAGPALLLTSALAPRPEARREGGSKRRRVRPVTVPLQLSGEAEGEQLSGSWPLRLFAIAIAILPARLTIAAIVLRLCSCGVVIFCCFGESSSRELRLLVAIIIAAIATAIAVPLR